MKETKEIDVEHKKFNDDRYQNGKASHYNKSLVETFDKMERVYGTYNFYMFCEMNTFKYRDRLGHKDKIELEVEKIKAYERKRDSLGIDIKDVDPRNIHHQLYDNYTSLNKAFQELFAENNKLKGEIKKLKQ